MKRYISSAIRNPEEEPAEVRMQLAGNPNTREDVLLSLSADKLCWSELAENPSTPLYILKRIFPGGGYWVDQAIIQHPNMDSATLTDMIKSGRLAPSNCRLAKERRKNMQ